MAPAIHWFRRDLRLHDNSALDHALEISDGQVVPVFIFDNAILHSHHVGGARVRFMLEALHDLAGALRERGSQLVVRHGEPVRALIELARETHAEHVFFTRDYTPFARKRDQHVTEALRQAGVGVTTTPDQVIWEPDQIMTKTGTPYQVYGPYRRQWRSRVDAEDERFRTRSRLRSFTPLPDTIPTDRLPSLSSLGFSASQQSMPGGETEARKRLKRFANPNNADGIGQYHHGRNIPARPASSQLSPYLHFGCISPHACVRAALETNNTQTQTGVDSWLNELAWRDFYTAILFHFPRVLLGAFKEQFNKIKWENNDEYFAAWREGRTGYPIIDAAMRQLNSEGWMHNRARMIVGSFLVKDLLIDWRWGERYFLQLLIDGDHASNNGGWQWVAGTGTDPQPYFRIFNPTSQSKKFDSHGEYIRRYLPELAHVSQRYIHTPWLMPQQEQQAAHLKIGTDYPAPIIDHDQQREKALAMYKQARAK